MSRLVPEEHEALIKCLSKGAKGYEKLLRKNGYAKLANKYVKRIADCESKGGYDSQFYCYKDYLKDKKGKYASLDDSMREVQEVTGYAWLPDTEIGEKSRGPGSLNFDKSREDGKDYSQEKSYEPVTGDTSQIQV